MKNSQIHQNVFRFIFMSLAVILAAGTSDGISYSEDVTVLLLGAALLSVLNLILKPILMLFALPFILVTFGFGIWVINALLFMLVGWLIPGFEVLSFWSALWGALLVSVMSFMANAITGDMNFRKRVNIKVKTPEKQSESRSIPNKQDSDVIDI